MNERQKGHVDFYLERLGYWKQRRPACSTARLLAARDADEAHPLRTEEEATEVVEHLWQLEREQAAGVCLTSTLKCNEGGREEPSRR